MRKTIIYIIGFIVLANSMFAQDPYDEFEHIIATYECEKYLSFQMDYRYFDENSGDEPKDSMTVFLGKQSKNYYVKMKDVHFLNTVDIHLFVNDITKEIVMREQSNIVPGFDLQQFINTADHQGLTLDFVNLKESKMKCLKFSSSDAKNYISIFYNPDNFRIQRTVLYSENEFSGSFTKIKASYSNYKLEDISFPFSENLFVQKIEQTYQPIDKLKHYKFYDESE